MVQNNDSKGVVWGPLGISPDPFRGVHRVKTSFIIMLGGCLPFYFHHLKRVQWSFPEAV